MSEKRELAPTTLLDERDALSFYLEALLREVPTLDEEPAPGVVAPAPPTPAPPAPTLAPPATQTQPAVVATAIIPDWASERFPVLLFKCGGLTLAVPLVELSGVQEWKGERITPMPGHSQAFLGLTLYRGRNVPVVDTARLVLPEDKLARLESSAAERVRRIVFIEDGSWGLACDEVAEVVSLAPDQVRWRTSRTRRKWLAGTVIEHMCALIDPPKFAEMLATGQEDEVAVGRSD